MTSKPVAAATGGAGDFMINHVEDDRSRSHSMAYRFPTHTSPPGLQKGAQILLYSNPSNSSKRRQNLGRSGETKRCAWISPPSGHHRRAG